jgi:hypothetical protein
MSKFNEEWKVGPHGPVEQLDDGLLTVAGNIRMPIGNFPRRMTVVALSDRRAAIWSAMPLREPDMRQIEAMGDPAFLIVPGIAHRLDIKPWKQRYPQAKVVCTPGARDAVEQVLRVDATSDVLDDPSVHLEAVPGVGAKEAALLVRRDCRLTLVLNDILANVRHPPGIGAHIMARLFGFGVKCPKMPWLIKRMLLEDKAALAAAFRKWADDATLARVVVSHGDVIERSPGEVLRRVATDLQG